MNVKRILKYFFILSIVFTPLVYSMSIGDFGKLCLFSGISGVITLNGEPVKHAVVKRQATRSHVQGYKKDETTTDEQGYFEMPPLYDRNIIGKFLPMEFVSSQTIVVSYQGRDYKLWGGIKRNREENSEARGERLIVECILDAESEMIEIDGGVYETKCKWDVEPDPKFTWDLPIPDDEI